MPPTLAALRVWRGGFRPREFAAEFGPDGSMVPAGALPVLEGPRNLGALPARGLGRWGEPGPPSCFSPPHHGGRLWVLPHQRPGVPLGAGLRPTASLVPCAGPEGAVLDLDGQGGCGGAAGGGWGRLGGCACRARPLPVSPGRVCPARRAPPALQPPLPPGRLGGGLSLHVLSRRLLGGGLPLPRSLRRLLGGGLSLPRSLRRLWQPSSSSGGTVWDSSCPQPLTPRAGGSPGPPGWRGACSPSEGVFPAGSWVRMVALPLAAPPPAWHHGWHLLGFAVVGRVDAWVLARFARPREVRQCR